MFSTPTLKKIYKQIPSLSLTDSTHDLSHSLRVAKNAIKIATEEGGDTEILLTAAILHDAKNLDKNHPNASKSSQLSAEFAEIILKKIKFPKEKIETVLDAIRCHSFSAKLMPQTKEGKIFQDADRLDALGAIGIARAFATGAKFSSRLYSQEDPFLDKGRIPNDKQNIVDHFFIKLFKIPEKMLTRTGKIIALERISFMRKFLEALKTEIY
jgi:uncharacterized protein